MSLLTPRVGLDGIGLQAKSRPAVCGRIPRSPPSTFFKSSILQTSRANLLI